MNFKQQYESLHDNNGGVTGSIEYTVYCKGVPIEHVEEHNLVVMQGRHRLAELCAGDSNMCIKRIGVGIGTPSYRINTLARSSGIPSPAPTPSSLGNSPRMRPTA